MAINLDQYKEQMLSAWKEVVDDKTDTDWALYSYEANTNVLKVVSKGNEGLEEMVEDLNSGKIMYAFCKVLDPNTSLSKYVLINWQGEAAPLDRKGKCANHFNDVKKFFKGVHVTINARTEDDVDTKLIIEKVAKSTVSTFNFKERSAPDIPTKPVGSVYKRTIPKAEINSVERDKFWEKEEAEERIRVEEEKKKAEAMKNKLEEERKSREIKEAEQRDARVKERMRSISELRAYESSKSSADSDRQRWEQQMVEDKRDEEMRRKRSDSLRDERKAEAETLISQRTIDARAIFEQNTAEGQMHRRASQGLLRQSSQNSLQNGYSSATSKPSEPPSNDETQLQMPDVIPTSPDEAVFENTAHATENNGTDSPLDLHENYYAEQEPENKMIQNATEAVNVGQVELISEEVSEVAQQFEDYNTCHVQNAPVDNTPHCIRARALYDYQAADETEISFDPDDIITHIEQIDEGWWQGVGPDGNYGLFPANYVELL